MGINANDVAKLRKATGAGMMDAKAALEEAGGDPEAAIDILRKKGALKAAKKAERETKEGLVHAYVHGSGKVGVLVEVFCETDFVARNDAFKELCHDLAMQIAATDPLYVKREDVPGEAVEKERSLCAAEFEGGNKPPEIVEKIVEGKMNKWYGEIVLMEQAFIKDEDRTIEQLLKDTIATIGENLQIGRFCRFTLGA